MMSEIYIIELSTLDVELDHTLMAFLPQERIARIQKYYHQEDKLRCFISGLVALWATVNYFDIAVEAVNLHLDFGEQPYATTVDGRKVFLSIAHSGNYVACMIDSQPCGIDVEVINREHIKIVERFFHYEEVLILSQISDVNEKAKCFTLIWTMKEAYLKFLGVGLSRQLSSFKIEIRNEQVYIEDSENSGLVNLECICFVKKGHVFSYVTFGKVAKSKTMNYVQFMNELREICNSTNK
jgi:4'-phosphopantetheinyl transferase